MQIVPLSSLSLLGPGVCMDGYGVFMVCLWCVYGVFTDVLQGYARSARGARLMNRSHHVISSRDLMLKESNQHAFDRLVMRMYGTPMTCYHAPDVGL